MGDNLAKSTSSKNGLSEVIADIKTTLAERLPQLGGKVSGGLISLSIGLSLAGMVQSAPPEVFAYLAGLAPNFISTILWEMRKEQRPVDAEAIAQAVADHLDDHDLRRLAEELEIIPALASTLESLKLRGDQIYALVQDFNHELAALKEQQWPVQHLTIDTSMTAQGENIAQAKQYSVAVIAREGSNVTVHQTQKRLVKILVSNVLANMQAQRQSIMEHLAALVKTSPADYELMVVPSQASSLDEARLRVKQSCDIYVGLIPDKNGPPDEVSIIEFELSEANRLARPVLLYTPAPDDDEQQAFIERLEQAGQGYVHLFDVFSPPETWGPKARADVVRLLDNNLTARLLPTSGQRGLIASLGRSPGAITGLYYALAARAIKIDYVWTVSTADRFVQRAARKVQETLAAAAVPYRDFPISAPHIDNEQDALAFKRAFTRRLIEARTRGDAVAIGIAGGRTVMGALLTQVSQVEAPANSAFYQLSVPDAIEEDGRYPYFDNQTPARQLVILNPTLEDQWRLVEISLSHFYTV